MQFMLTIIEPADRFPDRDDPATAAAYWAPWEDFSSAIGAAGVVRGGAILDSPAVTTTVRVSEGRRLVQDGPFADSKEQLGGFFLIEVADLDAALEWAARCPAAEYGSVEVRPLYERPTGDG